MNRLALECNQVWIYLAAIVAGLLLGSVTPATGRALEALLWPVIACLLYTTFTQVPLWNLSGAFKDHRFIAATLIGNFVLVPLLVWALIQFLPDNLPLRLGVLLVLLVPCTDWFITFCQLGRGSTSRAIAITPINLLLQLILLPVWIWLILGSELTAVVPVSSFLPAFLIVLVPLIAAAITERWIEAGVASPHRESVRKTLAWWPIPLLAIVIFLIAAAQAGAVREGFSLIAVVVPIFIIYLIASAVVGRIIAQGVGLPKDAGRTLIFSLGSRNSFVVLPFALALPAGWEITAIVIVVQSVVELFGMVFYLWWVPRYLLPD